MTTTHEQRFALKAAVAAAIADLQTVYGRDHVLVVPDGQAGAWVEIDQVELGEAYVQPTTFLVFLLPFNLPGADIYPMFVRDDLARRDGRQLGEVLQRTTLSWPGQPSQRPVVQVSRRTRGGAFTAQSAVQKTEKVLEWLRNT
ncbi:MAG: hypothetical protein ACRDOI_45565 [Trebonia sp.]